MIGLAKESGWDEDLWEQHSIRKYSTLCQCQNYSIDLFSGGSSTGVSSAFCESVVVKLSCLHKEWVTAFLKMAAMSVLA